AQVHETTDAQTGASRVELGEATGRDLGLRYDLPVALGASGLRFEGSAGLWSGGGPNRLGPAAPLYTVRVALARGTLDRRADLHLLVGASYAYASRVPLRGRCSFPTVTALTTLGDPHRIGGDVRLRWRRYTLGGEAVAVLGRGLTPAWSVSAIAAVDL